MAVESIFEELEVTPVINAVGTKTQIGGTRIRPEAREAMDRAAETFVRLSDLQAVASDRITEITGAEAGYVTNGAAGGLMLASAACIARTDPGIMHRLPDTDGIADEIVMPRTHRTGYDHALRTAGATIVDIGTNDRRLGTGSRNVEPWEYADAINEDTVAIGHVYKTHEGPSLENVCDIAHEHGLPVIVDAAAELPPVRNLSWFTEQGADLVVFSGGKGIRGPQTTGIIAGRGDLIESVAFQHLDLHVHPDIWEPPQRLADIKKIDGVPRQGIGRPLKVGKEELAGLLMALEAFVEEDHDKIHATWRERAEQIADTLADYDVLSTTIEDGDTAVVPEVVVSLDEEAAGCSTADLVLRLRQENPRVFVGADAINETQFTVSPRCLTDEEAEYVIKRIEVNLAIDEETIKRPDLGQELH